MLSLSDLDYWLIVGVSGQHRNLIPPLVYPEVRACRALIFVFFLLFRITRSITVRYLCSFVEFGNTAKQIAKPAYIDMEKDKPVSACGVFRSQKRHAGIILEGGWES